MDRTTGARSAPPRIASAPARRGRRVARPATSAPSPRRSRSSRPQEPVEPPPAPEVEPPPPEPEAREPEPPEPEPVRRARARARARAGGPGETREFSAGELADARGASRARTIPMTWTSRGRTPRGAVASRCPTAPSGASSPSPPPPPPAPAGTLPDTEPGTAHTPSAPRRVPAPPAPRRAGHDPARGRAARPAHARRRGPARIAALLVIIVVAAVLLWLVNAFLQPFAREGSGSVAVQIPDGVERRRDRRRARERRGRRLRASSSPSAPACRAPATTCAPASTRCKQRHELRRGDRRAEYQARPGARRRRSIKVDDPRGPRAPRDPPDRREGRPAGQLPGRVGEGARGLQHARVRRAARHNSLEGFLFPATYELEARRERRDAAQPPARRLRGELREGRHDTREAAQPHRLRRPHHRLDGRARGARREGAPAHRRGHPQPPARRACRSASTRRSATRRATGRSRCARASCSATRRTTRACARACRRPRSAIPGLASIRAAANPANRRLPLLRREARHVRGARVLERPTRSSSTTSQRYNAAREAAGGKSPTTC